MGSLISKIASLAGCAALVAASGCAREETSSRQSTAAESPQAETSPADSATAPATAAAGAADCDYDKWKDVSDYTVDLGLTADNILHVGKDATFELKANQNCKWTMKVKPDKATWPNWRPNIKLDCEWRQKYANAGYPMTGDIEDYHVCTADVKHPIHEKNNEPHKQEEHPLMIYPGEPDPSKSERYVHLRLEHEAASSNEHGGYAHGGGEE